VNTSIGSTQFGPFIPSQIVILVPVKIALGIIGLAFASIGSIQFGPFNPLQIVILVPVNSYSSSINFMSSVIPPSSSKPNSFLT